MTDTSLLAQVVSEHHKSLYQWFLLHQEALLCNEEVFSRQAWACFKEGLLLHIALENKYLFNSTNSLLATDNLRWGIHVYKKEHDKVELLLEKISTMLNGLHNAEGRVKRMALLEVLEKQISFRQLLEHHEEREEMDALCLLQGVTGDEVEVFLTTIEDWNNNHSNLLQCLKQHFSA